MRYLTLFALLVPALILLNSCSSNDPTMYELTVIPVPEEGGVVTPERTSFEEGREIEIFANPNEHWVFSEWDGDHVGTENNPVITMDSDKEILAKFVKREYPLLITIEGEGSVRERVIPAKTSEYEHNTVVELTAEAESGWEFSEWKGNLSGSDNPARVVIDGETEVTAVFERITYPLTIEIIGEGTVEEEILPGKTTDYEIGTVVQLTAVPDENYLFYEWSGDIPADEKSMNPVTVTMNAPKTVTAEFREGFELKTLVVPEGAGVIEPGSGVFIDGSTVTVEATPEYGWRFDRWSGGLSGSANPGEVTMSGDLNVTGHFERLAYPVTVSSEPVNAGEQEIRVVEGEEAEPGEYHYESILELTAVPSPGWEFVGWRGDIGDAVPEQNPIQVEVTEALNIEAVYSLQPGSLTVNNYVTIGSDWAPEVFTVHVLNRVSGELVESGEVAPNEPIQFERVPVGAYDVEFAGISGSNCVTVPNPQTAVISAGEETEVDFNISCGPGGELD